MSQPVNLVSRTKAIDAVLAQASEERPTVFCYGSPHFGTAYSVDQVTRALQELPKKSDPDLVDLSKVCNTLRGFYTDKLSAGANRGLARAEAMIKKQAVRV